MAKEKKEELMSVSVSNIWVNPNLVFRKWTDRQKFEQLRESVRARGVIEPVIVRGEQEKPELVLGLLRYLSVKEIGLKNIPVIFRDISDQDVLVLRLAGNNQQELSPFDEALYIVKLINEFNMKVKEIAGELGIGERLVNERVKLLSLCEEIQKMVFEGKLALKTAGHLVDMPIEEQKEWAKLAIEQDLSAAELYALVKKEDISPSGEKRNYVKNMTSVKISLRLESFISYLDKSEKAIFNLEGDDLLAVKNSADLLLKRVSDLQKQIQGKLKARRAA